MKRKFVILIFLFIFLVFVLIFIINNTQNPNERFSQIKGLKNISESEDACKLFTYYGLIEGRPCPYKGFNQEYYINDKGCAESCLQDLNLDIMAPPLVYLKPEYVKDSALSLNYCECSDPGCPNITRVMRCIHTSKNITRLFFKNPVPCHDQELYIINVDEKVKFEDIIKPNYFNAENIKEDEFIISEEDTTFQIKDSRIEIRYVKTWFC